MNYYHHAYYRPFKVGDKVRITEGTCYHQEGTVVALSDADAFEAEDTTYTVEMPLLAHRKQEFTYWQLESVNSELEG